MFSTYRRFKKTTSLRRYVGPGVVRGIKKAELLVLNGARFFRPLREQTRFRAIAHVGLQKTGSVWFREMLSDLDIYQYTGLAFHDCAGQSGFGAAPLSGLYSPMRTFDAGTAQALSQPDIAVLCVVRDPVAMILSWIKSTSKYHVTSKGGDMAQRRADLLARDPAQQIAYAVDYFEEKGRFAQFAALLEFCAAHPHAALVRYEDCIADADATFAQAFEVLDIRMPGAVRREFLTRHSFAAYSGRPITQSAQDARSPLQGRTHLDAQELAAADRAVILKACSVRIRQLYGYA